MRSTTHLKHLGANRLAAISERLAGNEDVKEGGDIGRREVRSDKLQGSSDGLASAPWVLGVKRLLDDHAVLIVLGQELLRLLLVLDDKLLNGLGDDSRVEADSLGDRLGGGLADGSRGVRCGGETGQQARSRCWKERTHRGKEEARQRSPSGRPARSPPRQ